MFFLYILLCFFLISLYLLLCFFFLENSGEVARRVASPIFVQLGVGDATSLVRERTAGVLQDLDFAQGELRSTADDLGPEEYKTGTPADFVTETLP